MMLGLVIVASLLAVAAALWFGRGYIQGLLTRDASEELTPETARRIMEQQPDRVRLVHQDLHSWRGNAAISRNADALFSKGFSEAGLYTVREIPGVMVRFLVKQMESMYAAIYMHPGMGVWVSLVTIYGDGRSATYTNAPETGLDQRPGHPIVHLGPLGGQELYARALAERPKGVFKPIMAEDVVAAYERAHADHMTWRKSRGGGSSAGEVAKAFDRRASTPPPETERRAPRGDSKAA